jgi:hypothetical protein
MTRDNHERMDDNDPQRITDRQFIGFLLVQRELAPLFYMGASIIREEQTQ